ncbi:hypothetical protein HDV05_007697, partial [Chytridiales sp. JEL 0842]
NSAYRSLDVIFNPTQVGDVTYLLSDGCLVPISTLLAKTIGSALLTTRDAFDARDRLWEARGSTINPSFLDVVKEAYLFKTDPVYANAYIKRRREKEDEGGDQLQLKKQNTTVDKIPQSPTTRDQPAVPSNEAQPMNTDENDLALKAAKKFQYALVGPLAGLDASEILADVLKKFTVELRGDEFLFIFREYLEGLLRKRRVPLSQIDSAKARMYALAGLVQQEANTYLDSSNSNGLPSSSLLVRQELMGARHDDQTLSSYSAVSLLAGLSCKDPSELPRPLVDRALKNAQELKSGDLERLSLIAEAAEARSLNVGKGVETQTKQFAAYASPVFKNMGFENIMVGEVVIDTGSDTGSELVVLSYGLAQSAKEFVGADTNFALFMHDANGGKRRMYGLIRDATVHKFGLKWKVKAWVLPDMPNPPFALLLGQPFGVASQMHLYFKGADQFAILRDQFSPATVEVQVLNSIDNHRIKEDIPREVRDSRGASPGGEALRSDFH